MKIDLQQTAAEHRVIVAHRGVSGGHIPCNTIPAYETALKQEADMIETDMDMTADGKLVVFHPAWNMHCWEQICPSRNRRGKLSVNSVIRTWMTIPSSLVW